MPDPSSPLFNAGNRSNTTILSWLTNSLSKEIAASVIYIYINTARDLWIDMRDRFAQGNVPRPLELPKEIARFSQSQLFVSSYSQNSRFFGMNL